MYVLYDKRLWFKVQWSGLYKYDVFFHRVASDGDIDYYADLKYKDVVYTSMMIFS